MENSRDDSYRWLRTGVLLWSIYYLLVMLVDALKEPGEAAAPAFYQFFGSAILAILLLFALLRALPQYTSVLRVTLLVLMAFLPFIGEAFILPSSGVKPWLSLGGSSNVYIRQWGPNLMTFVMIGAFFSRRYVFIYAVILATLNIAVAVMRLPFDIRVVSIGFTVLTSAAYTFVGLVIYYLRVQQNALQTTNARLLELAETVEDLAVSRERNRLARELHDTLAHSLSGLVIQLETIKAYWSRDPEMSYDLLEKSVETARSGVEETRRALSALRAGRLEDLGLVLAIQELAEQAALRADLILTLDLSAQFPTMTDRGELRLYRIAHQALANVVQHAKAKHLVVSAENTWNCFIFTIEDDGIGFNPGQPHSHGHFGIAGMRERAHQMDGELTINSEPCKGTRIIFTLPNSKGMS